MENKGRKEYFHINDNICSEQICSLRDNVDTVDEDDKDKIQEQCLGR